MAVFERERINLTRVFNKVEIELTRLGLNARIDESKKVYLLLGFDNKVFLTIHMSSSKLTYFKQYLPVERQKYDHIYDLMERIFYENC